MPQTRHATIPNEQPNDVHENVECTSNDIVVFRDVHNIPSENTEINNIENSTNNSATNKNYQFPSENVYIPKVTEIRIPIPKVERKKEFIF